MNELDNYRNYPVKLNAKIIDYDLIFRDKTNDSVSYVPKLKLFYEYEGKKYENYPKKMNYIGNTNNSKNVIKKIKNQKGQIIIKINKCDPNLCIVPSFKDDNKIIKWLYIATCFIIPISYFGVGVLYR